MFAVMPDAEAAKHKGWAIDCPAFVFHLFITAYCGSMSLSVMAPRRCSMPVVVCNASS